MAKQTYDTAVQIEEEEQACSDLAIYVAEHCEVCDYAHEMARLIQNRYPQIVVRIIDVGKEPDQVPDRVFATPTYLLNGCLWSLGNPSIQKVEEAFGEPAG